jgi:hypothetical protein
MSYVVAVVVEIVVVTFVEPVAVVPELMIEQTVMIHGISRRIIDVDRKTAGLARLRVECARPLPNDGVCVVGGANSGQVPVLQQVSV